MGQLVYRKQWQWLPQKKKYFLSMDEETVPFLLIDSLHIKYRKKPSDSIYYNRRIWLSTVIHKNCGCIPVSTKYYDEHGNVLKKSVFENGYEIKTIDFYPYLDYIKPSVQGTCKMVKVYNDDKKHKPYLINNIFYYDNQDSLIGEDINYTAKSGLRGVRLEYKPKGKVVRKFYDENTNQYVPEGNKANK